MINYIPDKSLEGTHINADLKICQHLCLHLKTMCRRFHIKTPVTLELLTNIQKQ